MAAGVGLDWIGLDWIGDKKDHERVNKKRWEPGFFFSVFFFPNSSLPYEIPGYPDYRRLFFFFSFLLFLFVFSMQCCEQVNDLHKNRRSLLDALLVFPQKKNAMDIHETRRSILYTYIYEIQ